MTPKEFTSVAISVQFLEKGRDYSGWDCYGLVYCAYRDVLKINLPLLAGGYEGTGIHHFKELVELISAGKDEWNKVSERSFFDAVLLRMLSHPVHIGLVLEKNKFIHTREKIGTQLDRFGSLEWPECKVEGYYHYGKSPYAI
jgi:hypothetical protein